MAEEAAGCVRLSWKEMDGQKGVKLETRWMSAALIYQMQF